MKIKHLALAFGLAGAAMLSTLALSVTLTAQNTCDKPAAYKVERKGSSLSTSLSQRASTSHNLDHGDRIKVGDTVVHTVSAASNGQTIVVCKK